VLLLAEEIAKAVLDLKKKCQKPQKISVPQLLQAHCWATVRAEFLC